MSVCSILGTMLDQLQAAGSKNIWSNNMQYKPQFMYYKCPQFERKQALLLNYHVKK